MLYTAHAQLRYINPLKPDFTFHLHPLQAANCCLDLQWMKMIHVLKIILINPFSPHDPMRHHFTSLKTDLIFLQPRVLERKFP